MDGRATDSAEVPSSPPQDNANAALRTFFRITEQWNLSTEDQITLLGSIPRSTFFKLKKSGGNIPTDMLERLSYILGIFKALQILFPTADIADAWIRKPNSASIFNGQSALQRMLAGRVADLYVVRQYLDAQRGE